MTSTRPQGAIKRSIRLCGMLLIGASVTSCATPVPVMQVLAAFPCSSNIPKSYRTPVEGAQPLPEGATVKDLAKAVTDASAGLDKANGRTADVIAITEACDAHQREVAKALMPRPWWRF